MRRIGTQKNLRDREKDMFEIHKCPNCGVEREFNMNYDKFLCLHCGQASTADVKKNEQKQ